MEAYTDFAEVYDTFMDNAPYEEWAEVLAGFIKKYGISRSVFRKGVSEENRKEETGEQSALEAEKDLVLDLGCGTGTLTELLYQKGYDMLGVDLSQEMLSIACRKREQSGSGILYLCQDMRELDLYSTVGTVVSVCDSVNYLLEDEEVVETFKRVNNYLYPGGIFIFDFNTVYKYEQVIGDTTIAENREECSFIWDNYYHDEERINEYDLTIFVKQQKELFERFQETHYQRGYTLEEMKEFVQEAGMELVLVQDADTHREPSGTSQRIYVIARECMKEI